MLKYASIFMILLGAVLTFESKISAQTDKKCCDFLNKAQWDNVTHIWNEKMFYKRRFYSLFYFPLNMHNNIEQSFRRLDRKGFLKKDGLFLIGNQGFFGGYFYIEITDYEMNMPREYISGKFISRYYQGQSYKEAKLWHEDMKQYLTSHNYPVNEFYTYYATCPECMKKFNMIQAVIFARIE